METLFILELARANFFTNLPTDCAVNVGKDSLDVSGFNSNKLTCPRKILYKPLFTSFLV
jgi:hypothetical protein